MITFNRNYFAVMLLLFVVEALIALYATDQFVRPYIGDLLVVVLIYCFVRSFFQLPVLPLAVGILIFSFVVEFLQSIHLVEVLGWGKSGLARTLLGTWFSWYDLLSYSAGIAIVLVFEKYALKKSLYGVLRG
jgi:hypothetical protein